LTPSLPSAVKIAVTLNDIQNQGLRGIEWVIFELKAREKRGLQGDSAFREMGYLA
jgi:hypothetical protein